MNWINKLERKFGKIHINNLMLILVLGNAFLYVLTTTSGNFDLINKLTLNPDMIMQGEVWRLITFIFVPDIRMSVIGILFTLYFYYLAGAGLESEWGSFKFNIYYLVGMIATIIISFSLNIPSLTGAYINLSLFLAFAKIYPDFQVLLFFIIPIKVKYLAIANWIIIIYQLITANSLASVLVILVPVFNFILFFGKEIIVGSKDRAINYKRKETFKAQSEVKGTFHKCTVCGVTEKDNSEMEFRYCSKCSGKKCYCINHITEHEHI